MIPNYKARDPKGWLGNPKYGAAMGRHAYHNESQEFSGHIYLRRIRLNSGGYDANGTYFGIGKPLFWYANEDNTIDAVLRADDRSDAIQQIRKFYPNAKFYRE